jgi:hypothetical protein
MQAVADSPDNDGLPRWAASVVAGNLAALAHVEFAFDTTLEWSVAPPSLVGTPGLGPGRAVLVGSRTSKTLDNLMAGISQLGLQCTTIEQSLAPSVIQVDGGSEEALAELSAHTDVPFEPSVAGRLLRCLPSLASLLRAAPIAHHFSGFGARRWDVGRLEWLPIEEPEGDGAFFFDSYRPEHRFVSQGTIKKVSRSAAIYLASAAAGERLMEYVTTGGELGDLIVPREAPPPALHARALVLCSGRLPTHDGRSRTLSYHLVPGSFAKRIARLLESLEDPDG